MHKLGCMCAAGCRNRTNAASQIINDMRSEARTIEDGPWRERSRRNRYVTAIKMQAQEISLVMTGPLRTEGKAEG